MQELNSGGTDSLFQSTELALSLCPFAREEHTCAGKNSMSNKAMLFQKQISKDFTDKKHTDICVLNIFSKIFSYILV